MRFISVIRRLTVLTLSALLLVGCQADLYTKLTETEANEIAALLLHNGIAASRVPAKDGTSTVRVEEGSFADAVGLLHEAGLPRPKFATMGDVFADTKLVSSPTEERARFMYALSQELSKTLSEIDGVIAARVHLVLPKNDPLREESKPSSASVFIKHDPNAALTSLLPQIKTLVTNSIEGLTYDKVSVVFIQGDRSRKWVSESGQKATSFASLGTWFSASELFMTGALALFLLLLGSWYFLIRLRRPEQLSESFALLLNRHSGAGSSEESGRS